MALRANLAAPVGVWLRRVHAMVPDPVRTGASRPVGIEKSCIPHPRILPGPRSPFSSSTPRSVRSPDPTRCRRGKATPLPHASQIRPPHSVLLPASHFSTFPPAIGRFAPLHLSLLCPPYSVLRNPLCLRPAPTCFVIHLSTFAPELCSDLHLCTALCSATPSTLALTTITSISTITG